MKKLAFTAVVLTLGVTGCSSTNDRGVIVSKPMDFFGAAQVPGARLDAPASVAPLLVVQPKAENS